MASECRYIAIDVECVATGLGHNDRRPASVAVVAQDDEILLDCKILQETPPLDYLHPFSGLKEDDFAEALAFDEVLETVRGLLGPRTIIVGQSVLNDINWLNLQKGRDFEDFVDLAEVFTTVGGTGRVSFYPLDYTCKVLLGIEPRGHSAAGDAARAMRLFNGYVHCVSQSTIDTAKAKLKRAWKDGERPPPRILHYKGICGAKYNPLKCICGQPSGKNM
jgi:RNA exonuclease 4